MLTLSARQLLQLYRKTFALDPSEPLCSIEQFYGIDIDDLISQRLRQWYVDLLHSRVEGLRPVVSSADSLVSVSTVSDSGEAILSLRDTVVSLRSVRLSGWTASADISQDSPTRQALAANPYSRPGVHSPVAWIGADGLIRAAPASPGSLIVEARAVVDPGPDTYILPSDALSHLPPITLNP